MAMPYSGSKLAGVLMLLMAPVALSIGSGDPSAPTLLGLLAAVATAAFGVMVFRSATTGAIVFLLLMIILALITKPLYPIHPFGLCVIALAIGALMAIHRVQKRDDDKKIKDASRCKECGMLPPEHASWCVGPSAKTGPGS